MDRGASRSSRRSAWSSALMSGPTDWCGGGREGEPGKGGEVSGAFAERRTRPVLLRSGTLQGCVRPGSIASSDASSRPKRQLLLGFLRGSHSRSHLFLCSPSSTCAQARLAQTRCRSISLELELSSQWTGKSRKRTVQAASLLNSRPTSFPLPLARPAPSADRARHLLVQDDALERRLEAAQRARAEDEGGERRRDRADQGAVVVEVAAAAAYEDLANE